jgi:hypothetical protein
MFTVLSDVFRFPISTFLCCSIDRLLVPSLLAPYLLHLSNSSLVCLVFACLWVASLGSVVGHLLDMPIPD